MQTACRVPSAGTIARLMTTGRDDLTESETVTIAAIEGVAALVEARAVINAFHAMIRKRAGDELDTWIERAQSSLVTSFANSVAKDKSAIGAAIASHWSKGQTEGQITKLKLVKR
jgi:transposase